MTATFEAGRIYNGRKADGKVITFQVVGVAHDRDQICFQRVYKSMRVGYFLGGYDCRSLIDCEGDVEKASLFDDDGKDILFSADDIREVQ